jgi:hypothetical protein
VNLLRVTGPLLSRLSHKSVVTIKKKSSTSNLGSTRHPPRYSIFKHKTVPSFNTRIPKQETTTHLPHNNVFRSPPCLHLRLPPPLRHRPNPHKRLPKLHLHSNPNLPSLVSALRYDSAHHVHLHLGLLSGMPEGDRRGEGENKPK